MTQREVVDAYLIWARMHYVRADGTQTGQAENLRYALRSLRTSNDVGEFGASGLREYQRGLIERGLARRTVNQWVGWARGMFRWAVGCGHIEAAQFAELLAVKGVTWRDGAREVESRGLLTVEAIAAVLEFMPSVVQRMVIVQWLSGMRPGEVVRMRRERLECWEGVWLYRPVRHKTEHYGRSRVVVLVPQAAKLVEPEAQGRVVFLTRHGGPYSVNTYSQAVRRACRKADVTVWSVGQLRRSAATYARRLCGAEAAQRLLGHASTEMTERYYDLGMLDVVAEASRLVAAGWSFQTGAALEWSSCSRVAS